MPLRFAHSCVRAQFGVFVHGPQKPTDEEWEAMCGESRLWSGPHEETRLLIISEGGTPNSRQRTRILETFDRDRAYRVAVVTRSPLARAVGSVLTWFYPGIRSFRPEQMSVALDYLGVTEDEERQQLVAEVERLRQLVGCSEPITRVS